MALENGSMNKKSIETIDRFIIDAIEYIRKKSTNRVDEPTIIDYLFNNNNSINVDKQVVENKTVIKILSELKTRQSWHQMTLWIIL